MTKTSVDVDLIRELAKVLREHDLSEIELGEAAERIRITRTPAPQTYAVAGPAPAPAHGAMPAPPPAADTAPVADAAPSGPAEGTVACPMVGTAYLTPEPGAAPFVRKGDTVSEGDTLLIVEAMKVMNPIVAPRSGKITEVLVENEQPVEYGQALLVIA